MFSYADVKIKHHVVCSYEKIDIDDSVTSYHLKGGNTFNCTPLLQSVLFFSHESNLTTKTKSFHLHLCLPLMLWNI